MSKNRNRNRDHQQTAKESIPSVLESTPVERETVSAPVQKKPKPATYSEMLKARAADKKQKALKLRKNGEA